EDVGDLGEWQSQAPQSADTVEPLGVALAIDAVSAVGTLTRDEQADLVVVMEGTDGETGGLREFPDAPGGHSSPSCTTSAMASAIRPCRAPGRLCPMPSIIISRAPGIASAVAIPPLGSHILSAEPWITSVGRSSCRRRSVRSPDASEAIPCRAAARGSWPRSKATLARLATSSSGTG